MALQDIMDRGLARGRSIWPAFKYQIPGLLAVHISDRAVVFGVYSGAYIHGYNYLTDVTYETLAQMVLTFDQAMTQLTAEEQRTVIDITAKRYIEDQTLAAKDAALDNKARKVTQKAAEVDQKVSAIEADRQALATKITELEVLQRKAATIIIELEAKIEEQSLEAAHVEAEITRQQLLQRKAELDVIETGIRALEIQAQVADAAYRLASIAIREKELESEIGRIGLDTVEVNVRASQTQADTARMITQKAAESLAESELAVARAETDAYKQETIVLKAKGPLLDQRIEAATTEIEITIPELADVIEKEKEADLTNQEARNQRTVSEYENRTLSYEEKVKTSNAVTKLDTDNFATEGNMIKKNADNRAEYDAARVWANKEKIAGAEEAATIMAKANIVNTITHQIGAAK